MISGYDNPDNSTQLRSTRQNALGKYYNNNRKIKTVNIIIIIISPIYYISLVYAAIEMKNKKNSTPPLYDTFSSKAK